MSLFGPVRERDWESVAELRADENERLRAALYDVTMIFAARPDIYALTGFAERPVIERARELCNAAPAASR